MKFAKHAGAAFAGALFGMVATQPAMAQTSSASTSAVAGWEFTIAPYFWTAGLEGNVGAFGLPEVSVDAGFSDILDNLNFAAMAMAEVRRERFGIFLDVIYLDLETDGSDTPGPLFSTASVTATTRIITPMLEYRIREHNGASVDGMAGARIWYAETGINLAGGTLSGRGATDDETWVDPAVGLKGRVPIAKNWALGGWGIIGGFGAGSDFMWDVFFGVNYAFNDWFSGEVGYRGMGTDFRDNGYVFDVTMNGPVLAAVFRF